MSVLQSSRKCARFLLPVDTLIAYGQRLFCFLGFASSFDCLATHAGSPEARIVWLVIQVDWVVWGAWPVIPLLGQQSWMNATQRVRLKTTSGLVNAYKETTPPSGIVTLPTNLLYSSSCLMAIEISLRIRSCRRRHGPIAILLTWP